MPAQIKLTSTRPNTNVDFWWTTTNPAVVSVRNSLAAVFEANNVPSEFAVSGDGLSCTMTYTVDKEGDWPALVSQTKTQIPNLQENRKGYHITNGHTFKLEVRSMEGDLLQEVQVV